MQTETEDYQVLVFNVSTTLQQLNTDLQVAVLARVQQRRPVVLATGEPKN